MSNLEVTKRNNRCPFLISLAIAFLALSGTVNAATKYSQAQLTDAIAKVREGQCRETQRDANKLDDCMQLAEVTRHIKHAKVDDKTIVDLSTLLDSSNDYVRLAVAASLGNFGPRAKFAAPKLLEILHQVDCLQEDMNSAAAIRPALRKMGIKPPSRICP
jgi:hypothetical protein